MKFESTLDNNNTKLGLPQEIETLDEIEFLEYDSQNYAEFGMLIDCMEVSDENYY